LLVQSALNRFSLWGNQFNPRWVVEHAGVMANSINLPPQCLDATLMVAYQDGDQVHIVISGDGVVILRMRDSQEFFTYRYSFSNNVPGYLSYTLDPQRLETFFDPPYDFPDPTGVRTLEKTWGWGKPRYEATSLDPQDLNSFFVEISVHSSIIDLVMICSDGVESFQERQENGSLEPVHFMEVAEQLSQIKKPRGEFVTRRMQKFLGSFCKKNNWTHSDDLAVAGIFMEEER
jgi:hypothetical protein